MLKLKRAAGRVALLAAATIGLSVALSIGLLATRSLSVPSGREIDRGPDPIAHNRDDAASGRAPNDPDALPDAATAADLQPPVGGDGEPAAGATPTDDTSGAERLKVLDPDTKTVKLRLAADDATDAAEGAGGGSDVDVAGADAVTDTTAIDGAESPLAAGTVSLSPVADVFVISGGDAGKNFGASKSLKAMKASKNGDVATQSYLRFDIGAVGTISKATLRLYCNNDSRDSFDVFVSPVSWDERTMTWKDKPAAAGAVVASAMATREGQWVEVDVTPAVRASASVAFALLPRSTDAFAANSRESGSNPPLLVLQTTAAPAAPPVAGGGGPITVEADAYVRSTRPTANFGTQKQVAVSRDDDDDDDVVVGYLRFRVGDVGNVAKATVRLYVEGASDDSADVHFVSANDWGETTVTWNNRPAVDGPRLNVIGDTKSGKWLDVDVSTVVVPNSLLTLALVPRSNDDFEITSREGANKPQLALATVADDALNLDCTLIVPDDPLSPKGLATPYELVATDPANGACHEYVVDQRGFVEAAILDPATGQISIYHPLVIDKGTVAVIPPVVPSLPPKAVVAIWLGYNGDVLRQRGATPNALARGKCVGGLDGDAMGQFSHCNAEAFFEAANRAIARGQLTVPPLGTGSDGLPCPTVRDFFTVDQDQSDNVLTTYLLTRDNRLAPDTAANRARLGTGAKVITNPSDNRVTAVLLDGALGCTPWNAPSLDNPGTMVPSLVLNELLAAKWQAAPQATVPLLDPFALTEDGEPSLAKLNLHRAGVGQAPIKNMDQAVKHQEAYCRDMRSIQPARLFRDRALLEGRPSPFPDVGNSAFAFLVTRFNVSWELLTCTDLIGLASPITLIQDAGGVTVGATLGR